MTGRQFCKIHVIFGLFLAALSMPVQAQGLDPEIQKRLENALVNPGIYTGFKVGRNDYGEGTFCQKEASWHVYWKAVLGSFRVDMTPEANARVQLEFDNSFVDFSGFRKGGLLCMWNGGAGRASVRNLKLEFILRPVDENGDPQIDIRGVKIHGLAIDRVDVSGGVFYLQNSEAPQWMTLWLESNFNHLIELFLKSSLKKRLDEFVSKELKDWLDENRENGFSDL